jgi:DNA-binding FrmR family transcriptional regulator
MSHASNKDLTNRLKRAHGHLAKITAMVAEDRDALDIAQQLQAVISALENAKTFLVAHHIEHHLEETMGTLSPETRDNLARLTTLAKYL